MKVKELMQGYAPDPVFEGWVTNDDYVFAIDLAPGADDPTDYEDFEVVEMGIAGLDAQMNPVTQDKQYIRAGQTTMKTGTQRTFAVTGDRYVGDPAQDYCLSHRVKYGTGNAVVTRYVYFNLLNGKGETGSCSIIVNSDGSGNAGESSAVDIEFKKIGATPTEYTYAGPVAVLASLNVTTQEGTDVGDTKVNVTPARDMANSYRYKTGAGLAKPAYNEVCTAGYTEWNGTDDITANTGEQILVVEVDAENRAKAAGIGTVTARA